MPPTPAYPEGFASLAVMERDAPNYNAWLGTLLRAHLGRRVLEVGAGIGTITRQILPGRELVIALEAEKLYATQLAETFRNDSRVKVIDAPVESIDWSRMAGERVDSIVLSNVLEHIEDDSAAVRNLRTALQPGGNVVILVPALPVLFGTLDEAVGHYRRYMPRSLRSVIERNGFRVERLDWLNLLGIPGWLLNGRVLRRRVIPSAQLRAYDRIAPFIARVESMFRLPIGMSLLAVAYAI
jgi:SAM-dependent methyltransferase